MKEKSKSDISTPTTPSNKGLKPTPPQGRIATIDILRGFALLGILVVNMSGFNTPVFYLDDAGIKLFPAVYDRIVEHLIDVGVEGKFFTLFSFLFGLNFCQQMFRAEAHGVSFARLYGRRLVVLLLIGLIHAYLIWMGDILISYAALGLLLVPFRKLNPKLVLVCAIVLFLFPIARWQIKLVGQQVDTSSHQQTAATATNKSNVQNHARAEVESSQWAYAHGSFSDIMKQRARDVRYSLHRMGMARIFSMFLFGLYAGRRRMFSQLQEGLPFLRRIFPWCLSLAVFGTICLELLYLQRAPEWTRLLRPLAYAVSFSAQFLSYYLAVILLSENPATKRWMAPLREVGRMALTNYLLQSVVCTAIFYSYGLGFYWKVGPALGLGLSFLIYFGQIIFSTWWLRRFRFGPVEWAWRSLTYGEAQPMRS